MNTDNQNERDRSPFIPRPLSPKHRLVRALGAAHVLSDIIAADAIEYSQHLASRADVASMLADEIGATIADLERSGS